MNTGFGGSVRIGALIVLIFGGFIVANAQTAATVSSGLQPYGTFHGGDIDTVSLANGTLSGRIPIASYSERGGKLAANFSTHISSWTAHLIQFGCPYACTEMALADGPGGPYDIFLDLAAGAGKKTFLLPNGQISSIYYYMSSDSSGATHQLAWTGGTTYRAVDASGLLFDSSTGVMTFRDGVRYGPNGTQGPGGPNNQFEDANGNIVTLVNGGGMTDTLGKPIETVASTTDYSGCTGPNPINSALVFSFQSLAGTSASYKECRVNVPYNFYLAGIKAYGTSFLNAVQSLVLPNGTAWTFQYDATYGALSSITFPTGGSISYTWSSPILNCGSAGLAYGPQYYSLQLATRTVNANDGSGSHTWTYHWVPWGSTTPIKVTDPLANDTLHTMSGLGASCAAYETQTQYYQGSSIGGTLLKTVKTDFTYSPNPNAPTSTPPPPPVNVVPIRITTTLPSTNQVSKVEMDYDSGFSYTGNVYSGTATYGNVIAKREYGFGTGAPGALIRQTKTTYQALGNSNYLTRNLLDQVASSTVLDGSGAQKAYTSYGYDEYSLQSSGITTQHDSAPPVGSYRGNQTSVRRWMSGSVTSTANCPISVSNGYLTTYKTYFDTGTVSQYTDPCGTKAGDASHTTTTAFSSTYAGASPTASTNPLGQQTSFAYDFDTGLLTSTMDPNSQTTSKTYDNMWRLTNVTYPAVGGHSAFCYTDIGGGTCSQAGQPYKAVVTDAITGSFSKTSTGIVDGFGRTKQTQLTSDPEGIDSVDITYDANGRKASESNFYRGTSDSTYGVTSYAYDGLNRPIIVTEPDGSTVKTAYCDNWTLVKDEAGHWRRSKRDGLGRLVEVDEPNSSTATVNPNGCPGQSDPVWATTYTYDTLDNITGVVQAGSRQRSFVYDSLSRLTSAINPESGTLKYTYDADGSVVTKTTPQQNQTNPAVTTTLSYCYDALNRMTSKAYTAQSCPMTTPVATYSYDQSSCLGQASCYNVGHRTGMTDPAGSESWAYDAIGRPIAQSRTTNGITKTTSYTYNYDGSLSSITYPSGRVLDYTPDTLGRTSNVKDATTSVLYATGTCANGVSGSGVCYAPQGALAQVQNGASLLSTHIYNNRLQPCWLYSTTGTALAWQATLCNGTATVGTLLDLKYNFGFGADNGNPVGITNDRVTNRSQAFTYDQLNRIATAETTATSSDPTDCWGQAFGYDSTGNWGNLLSIGSASSAYTGCTQGNLSVAINAANQMIGDTYDAAGNLITSGASYVYNAENQMTATAGVNYVYDGDGNRVEKSGSKIYWYGNGDVLDETDATGSITNSNFNEYVFFGGKRIARRDSSGNVFYYLADQLGTSRIIAEVPSGQTTATLCYDADFYPFGAERTYTNTCSQNYKFTGKERDPESNLDDFGVRYYASNMGRFMSADSPFADQHPDEPQSWNLYSYATNNPLRYIDSNGRVKEDANGNVVFDKTSSGTVPFMNNAPVTLGNGQAGTITITWKADFGTIYADDGTKIQASKATSDMSVVVHDENGKVVQQGGSEVLGNGYSDSADCHGTTFANGQVWINNDQVPALIKGDGYEQTTKPGPGDVGVFTKTGDLSTTVHSVKVDQVDSKTGKVEEVTSKGGITPKVETTPEKAWTDPAQLQYYKQPKKAVQPNVDGLGGCYIEDQWY